MEIDDITTVLDSTNSTDKLIPSLDTDTKLKDDVDTPQLVLNTSDIGDKLTQSVDPIESIKENSAELDTKDPKESLIVTTDSVIENTIEPPVSTDKEHVIPVVVKLTKESTATIDVDDTPSTILNETVDDKISVEETKPNDSVTVEESEEDECALVIQDSQEVPDVVVDEADENEILSESPESFEDAVDLQNEGDDDEEEEDDDDDLQIIEDKDEGDEYCSDDKNLNELNCDDDGYYRPMNRFQPSIRIKMKRRSIKWLNKRMRQYATDTDTNNDLNDDIAMKKDDQINEKYMIYLDENEYPNSSESLTEKKNGVDTVKQTTDKSTTATNLEVPNDTEPESIIQQENNYESKDDDDTVKLSVEVKELFPITKSGDDEKSLSKKIVIDEDVTVSDTKSKISNHSNDMDVDNSTHESSDEISTGGKETNLTVNDVGTDNNTDGKKVQKRNHADVDHDEEGPESKKSCKTFEVDDDTDFDEHNKKLNDILETKQTDTVDKVDELIETIQNEIHSLSKEIDSKEYEWNQLIYMKHIKEELLTRVTRKKVVMSLSSSQLMNGKDGNDQRLNEIQNILIESERQMENLRTKGTNNHLDALAMLANKTASETPPLSTAQSAATSSTVTTNSTAQYILQTRANMNSAELAKEKKNAARIHRPILPKPSASASFREQGNSNASNNQQSILNSYITAAANLCNNDQKNQTFSQQLPTGGKNSIQTFDLDNGNEQQLSIGRKGPIRDVSTLIANYRQQHPETVPRRGRRLRNSLGQSNGNVDLSMNARLNDLGLLAKYDGNSRPSSADSSHSNSNNPILSSQQFEALVQYANMNRNDNAVNSNILAGINMTSKNSSINQAASKMSSYPEVTLHPVNASQSTNNSNQLDSTAGTLLHDILTKNNRQTYAQQSSTLARLLTAPERISNQFGNNYQQNTSGSGVNLIKGEQSEITITPVAGNSHNLQDHLLQKHQQYIYELEQQQLQQQQQQQQQNQQQSQKGNRVKSEMVLNMDDEADDSVDRLVIDEGDANEPTASGGNTGQEFHENEVPECQGCKKREAQFVCAGCSNQWYCSRECQVSAWDEHSEVCTG